jgi:hypothetical protein
MLSQWKQHIEPSEFEILIDFVNKTKDGQKWGDQKYIYLYGKNQSLKDKLINDICKIVGKDDCKYCKPNPDKPILIKNLFKDEEDDEDDEKYNQEHGDEDSMFCESNLYINKKLLIFNKKVLRKSQGFIKNVVGNDKMIYYAPGVFKIIIPNSNIIIYADKRITMHSAMMRRTVFINLINEFN